MAARRTETIPDLIRFLDLLWRPGDLREVRIPKHNKWGHTASGYFDSLETLAQAVLPYDGKANIYVTLNPADPALLARANNRIISRANHTTADDNILRRRFLPVDIDPERPSGISTTDAELEIGAALLERVIFFLMEEGWPDPITAMSGNGCYALYPIDLPNDAEALSLVQATLAALDRRFSTEQVNIDTTMANAARIIGIIGTMKVKGDETEDRPHRRSRILSAPDESVVVTEEKLRALAASVVQRTSTSPTWSPRRTTSERLVDLLDRHGIDYREQPPDARGFTWYHLRRCPFHSDGRDFECGVGQQLPDGPYAGHCFHPESKDKGWREWRQALSLEFRSNGHKGVIVTPKDGAESLPAEMAPIAAFPLTDLGNAERLAARFGDRLRFEQASGDWHHWSGMCWERDETLRVEAYAALTARAIYTEAAAEDLSQRRDELGKHARTSESRPRQQAMVASARHMLAIEPKQWDRDPWLLNCKNGTIDLRTGELRPHRREDLITMLSPVEYDPEARAPIFEAFLAQVQPDPQVRRFDQLSIGYSLTGVIREQYFWFLLGVGANGKGTLLNSLLAILGDYAKQAPPDLLLAGRPRHPTELAFLRGARLVVATETQEGSRLDESRMKQLTGGDPITARFMGGDFFTFEPSHKLWLMGNHKPEIQGTDHGIWRRPLLVDFPVMIPDAQQDHELPDKLLSEAPGILRWCVEGCLSWQKEGLRPPHAVLTATAQYRLEMDVVGEFLQERCYTSPGATEGATPLHRVYTAWCEANGERPLKQREFGRRLKERGFLSERGTGGRVYYCGLGLLHEGSEGNEPTWEVGEEMQTTYSAGCKTGSLGSLASLES